MDILKIATAGSVDDGKSTLIGRLLYDTRSVTKDKLEAVESSSKRKGLDFVDLSLLTDGLIAEREQGITIDVAHIFFSTATRKYIIADSPGHIEYTRNMITGASTAEVFIVLIDARNGVIEQTKRHLFIASLVQPQTVFVCINKMDLVHFDESIFNSIAQEVDALVEKMNFTGKIVFIPIVAKDGDNVVHLSQRMKWYTGGALIEYLESTPVHKIDLALPARFSVQVVIRPHSDEHHDFRGYAGKLSSGVLSEGQRVMVLPTMQHATIKEILHAQGKVSKATAGQSITIQLHEDVDASRGNMIVDAASPAMEMNNFSATVAWLNEQPMSLSKTYLLQHGVNVVKAKLTGIISKLNIHTIEEEEGAESFKLNDIGKVQVKTAKPVFVDSYIANPRNGAFILIDEFTNNTVGVGFIL